MNQFVRGRGANTTAEEALRGFERFLIWMWRNTVVVDFVGWLRERNDRLGDDEWGKAGFYGLDLYSLYRYGDGLLAEDELFYAEQNAKTVKNAAQYYRSMFS